MSYFCRENQIQWHQTLVPEINLLFGHGKCSCCGQRYGVFFSYGRFFQRYLLFLIVSFIFNFFLDKKRIIFNVSSTGFNLVNFIFIYLYEFGCNILKRNCRLWYIMNISTVVFCLIFFLYKGYQNVKWAKYLNTAYIALGL